MNKTDKICEFPKHSVLSLKIVFLYYNLWNRISHVYDKIVFCITIYGTEWVMYMTKLCFCIKIYEMELVMYMTFSYTPYSHIYHKKYKKGVLKFAVSGHQNLIGSETPLYIDYNLSGILFGFWLNKNNFNVFFALNTLPNTYNRFVGKNKRLLLRCLCWREFKLEEKSVNHDKPNS